MIEVVILGAVRQHDARLDLTNQSRDLRQRRLIVHHQQVALLDAMIDPANDGRGGGTLRTADASDFLRGVLRRTTVSRRHGGKVDCPVVLATQARKRSAAEELRVVGMSEDRQDRGVHSGWCGPEWGPPGGATGGG